LEDATETGKKGEEKNAPRKTGKMQKRPAEREQPLTRPSKGPDKEGRKNKKKAVGGGKKMK